MSSDWKERLGVVYSTNAEFSYRKEDKVEPETLPPGKQNLRVMLDKKNRKGKTVTLVTGFTGTETDFQELARSLKIKCGTGGSAVDGVILLQGDFCLKVMELLQAMGYKAKRQGG